ncbi:MAG: cupin domain-containing protein [Burkholderiales bacterium]|nr:cupin domain-containing protein [Burkholderiales bacterium]
MEGQAKTHLLNPNAVRVAKSLGDAAGLTQLGLHLMTVMPGHESTEYHRHLFEEQCFYILSGRSEVVIDEQRHPIEPGDFLGFPRRGAAHTMVNTGDEPLVFLTARTLLEQDVCDYPRQHKRLYMTGAEEALVDFKEIKR